MDNATKQPLWRPYKSEETNVANFIHFVNEKHNVELKTYHDLHKWSVDAATLQDFWADAYIWLGLSPNAERPGRMLETKDIVSTNMFPPPRFFPNTTLNIAEIMFRGRDKDDIAIHFAREGVADVAKVTWGSLRARVRRTRAALWASGVRQGDVVAAVISNSVETFVIALATLSFGGIWSSSSSDLGTAGVVDRYSQVNPKIIFADDGYVYAGKAVSLQDRVATWSSELAHASPKLTDVVIVPYCDFGTDVSKIAKGCTLDAFLERDNGAELIFSHVAFSHPAFILYSSGTTGRPKCLVHSTGGVALKVKTDMALQHDVRRSDVVFQYTTASWVMWVLNFVSLSCAKAMLLYDGSPFKPRPTILLELAESVGVSVFGTSPRYLFELKNLGIKPREQFDLSSLRIMTSTGSVLSEDLYDWFYTSAFPPTAQLISMSGGTDIAGCFVCGTPLLPVYAGEIQCKALGMAVDILDTAEECPRSIEDTGTPGELVCIRPFPSQPLAFIGQQGQEKYRASYFDRFGPSIWHQGDFIQKLNDTGGLVMLGRSDGVLNPSGIRFGSAEIYAVTETIPEILDSLCVGQKRAIDSDERVLLFIKLKAGQKMTTQLVNKVKTAIRDRCSPRHVPKLVFEIGDIPYTVNGKKCEINVKHIVSGRVAAVSGTVSNPEALKLYEKYQILPADKLQTTPRSSKL